MCIQKFRTELMNHRFLFQYDETMKRKYISVDLSEVELSEFDGPSHSLNNTYLLDVSIKNHFKSHEHA